jgi:predicted ATP-dependent endonuclease of OLD family
MLLKAFRVRMYKCVYDSGWIEVSPLTAMIGKNESGKTSLLNALYRFNPFKPENYVMEKEWPRSKRKERDENQVVCSTRFELTPEETDELSILTGQNVTESCFEVTRNYAGRLEVLFPPGLFPDKHNHRDVDEICNSIPGIQEPVCDLFREKAHEYIKELREFAYDGRFSEIVKMFNAKVAELRAVATNDSPGSPESKNEETFIYNYASQISIISRKLSETRTTQEKAQDFIINHLPTFIYMSDYQIFSGSADLQKVKQNQAEGQLTEEEKTLLAIMELAGLSLEEEIAKENSTHKDERQYDLDDASIAFTKVIAERWKQRRYEVQFRSDGHWFYTFVKDERDQSLIRLEERSKGFQWFFSFDLMFMNESKGTFRNCVILLDEPGLHLHPDAQQDLIRRMEEYSKSNILIYTTHLPLMLDLEKPECIRILREEGNGTVVSEDFRQCQPDEKLVLDAALVMNSGGYHQASGQNLVLPGMDDYWIINELSRLWLRSGERSLPEDLYLFPAGNMMEAIFVTVLMVGRKVEVMTILNSDEASNAARRKYEENWAPRYGISRSNVTNLAECVEAGEREFWIEDLFPSDYYLAKVQEVYKKQLAIVGCEQVNPAGNGPLAKRVAAALEKYEVRFDKSLVVKAIRSEMSRMTSISQLPELTREMGRKLIATVNGYFEREQ